MDYKIPLFDLNFDEAEEHAVLETLRCKWISSGPKVAEFERKFAGMLGIEHAVALANCTVALHLAMTILEIGEGDEVICPSFTFVATVNAIRYTGAMPVFCDIIGTDDLNVDPTLMESLITPKTKAVVVMHYGGFPCEMDRVMSIARKHNLKVIEDACHGPLSDHSLGKLGTIGDIGCFSFFSNKNISTGEGGMLVTSNPNLAAKAKLLRSHGMTSVSYDRAKGHSTAYDVVALGYNYRMDDIRAAIGIVQLEKLRTDLVKRSAIRQRYIDGLLGIPGVAVPFSKHSGFVSNYIFPIVLMKSNREKRDQVREALQGRGIQTSVHYPAVHKFSIYADQDAKLPQTEYVTDNEVTLPMYSNLSHPDVDYVIESLRGVL